jgi:hypothetical protein
MSQRVRLSSSVAVGGVLGYFASGGFTQWAITHFWFASSFPMRVAAWAVLLLLLLGGAPLGLIVGRAVVSRNTGRPLWRAHYVVGFAWLGMLIGLLCFLAAVIVASELSLISPSRSIPGIVQQLVLSVFLGGGLWLGAWWGARLSAPKAG